LLGSFLLFEVFIVDLIVEDFYEALTDEEHFLHVTLVADHNLAGNVNSAEHVDDQFVGETTLTLFEEVVERFLELLESPSVLDEFRLHLRGNLLIELELLNDEVEVIQEGLLYVSSNVVVERGLNVEGLVGLLNLFDPHV